MAFLLPLQPVVGQELQPEDEIRHAQRMIDHADEDDPEGRVVRIVGQLSNCRFNIDFNDPKDNGNTLLHYSCVVRCVWLYLKGGKKY